MKRISINLLTSALALAFLLTPLFALAQNTPQDPSGNLIPCGYRDDTGKINECDFEDFMELIRRVINFLIVISVPLAAVSFAYAGFLYITAQGSPGQISKAHGIFKKTLIGFIFVLGAWLIVYTIINALLDTTSDPNINLLDDPNQ